MSYPLTDREIRRLARKTVLLTLVARGVARKAGLRRGTAVSRPTTVIDGYIHPLEAPLSRQYIVDFTGKTQVRLASQSSTPIYIHFSQNTESTSFDPGDYIAMPVLDATSSLVFLSASAAESVAGEDLRWRTLFEFQQRELRLAISTSQNRVEIDQGLLDGPFSLALEVF